jgi:hypothetical protein
MESAHRLFGVRISSVAGSEVVERFSDLLIVLEAGPFNFYCAILFLPGYSVSRF